MSHVALSHLDWPFFDAVHRERAAALAAWADAQPPDAESADPRAETARLVRAMGRAGWLGWAVPAPAGADDRLDVRTLCLARETLAYRSALADFAFAMQGLGSGPISLVGTDEQRARWLPAAASGEAVCAFALSEAEAGSDVAALATTARPDGDAWVLDGEKTWISNAGLADRYVVFARTGGDGHRGLGAFVVDADTEGLSVPHLIETVSPHPLGTVRLDGCRVPGSALLGQPGDGFKIALATLDVFRSTVGAAAVGMARRALDETVRHVRQREIFGGTLADLQLVQGSLAQMATDVDAAALLVYRAAWTKDAGAERITKEAAMAKAHATEAAQRVIDTAVQLHGGHGVTAGHIVERLYRDIRPLRIYEGATAVQHVVIARQLLRDA
ncbi:acyl-CoA dehydrogenase family protein [Rubrivirga sp. IMCC43871]|uniref:acyl-CoA dehydrogenase family protein n=1 Tax=Rubrivirga sp. IMCC43871 TaxID=3391575 RepID=UPI0039901059